MQSTQSTHHRLASWPVILTLVLLLGIPLVGCQRASRSGQDADTASIVMDVSVEPSPPGVGPSLLKVNLASAAGEPIEGATLQIRGDMAHAGMVPVLAETAGGPKGLYEVPFEWTMGGDWVVTVSADLPGGETISREFEITVMGDMPGDMEMKEGEMPMEATETP